MRQLAAVGVVVAAIFAFFLIKNPQSRPQARGPQLVSVEALLASGDYCEPGYDALPPLVYQELHRLAAQYMARERIS